MTYSLPVKNQQVDRSESQWVDHNDFSSYDSSEELGADQFISADARTTPSSLKDLQFRVQQLKLQLSSGVASGNAAALKAEVQKLENAIGRMTPAQRLSQMGALETKLSGLENQILGFDNGLDELTGVADANGGDPGVTPETINALLKQIENGDRVVAEGAELSLDDCKQKLRDAATALLKGDQETAEELYGEAFDALGGEKTPDELLGDQYGEMPSRKEGDTLIYDGKDATSFNFNAAGKGKTCVAENATDVTITPSDKKAEVVISVEGDNYVITVGNDTFKVSKDAKINILSDHVTGPDVANSKGNITVGASEKTATRFMDPSRRAALARTLSDAVGKIATEDYYRYSDDLRNGGGTYNPETGQYEQYTKPEMKYGVQGFTGGSPETDDAKKVIKAFADAVAEGDPKKQKDAWENAQDVLVHMRTNVADPHYLNNRAQIIFNVLYGELGEDGLKQMLTSGMMPMSYANELSTQLESVVDETNSMGEIEGYLVGGPKWTHGTSSEFLKKYSQKSKEEK